jgi:hypothetical protein
MRTVLAEGGVRIFDDVLSATEFAGLTSWAERVTYQGVHHDRWRTVWRLGEGEPWRGPTWVAPCGKSAVGDGRQPHQKRRIQTPATLVVGVGE